MTTPPTSSTEVEVRPDVVFVAELLRELTQGRVRIPRFQRPFVWRNEQMTDLLDSVRQQYPIGSLLVWETDIPVATLDGLGPFVFPASDQQSVGYLLDGHQRLSTLAGALIASDDDDVAKRDDRWRIWWDMASEKFQHGRGAADERNLFPTTALLDTLRFFDAVDKVRKDWSEEPAVAEAFVGKISRLAQAFQHYRVPVIRIRRTGLSEAVEIFARLNSRGQPMSADQMVGALLYREGTGAQFDLATEIDNLAEMLGRQSFGDTDRTTILRAILANLGEDIYKTDWTRLTAQRRDVLLERMRSAVTRTSESLELAVNFLISEGVTTSRLLPYSIQLVLLSSFFDACKKPTAHQTRLLRRFFWGSSFSGWFSGANPTRVNYLVEELRSRVAFDLLPSTLTTFDLESRTLPFPANFDMRSARTRCVISVMLKLRPRDSEGHMIEQPWRAIAEQGPSAMGRIFAGVSREWLSNAANRMLRPPGEVRSSLAPWLLEASNAGRVDILESHGVNEEARRALHNSDAEAFIRARQSFLVDREREFQDSLSLSGSMDQAGATPIDAD